MRHFLRKTKSRSSKTHRQRKHRTHHKKRGTRRMHFTRKRRSHRRQRGGGFNESEKAELVDAIKQLNISDIDDAEIDRLVDKLGLVAQQFSGHNIGQLLNQIDNPSVLNSRRALEMFVNNTVELFEDDVETDTEMD